MELTKSVSGLLQMIIISLRGNARFLLDRLDKEYFSWKIVGWLFHPEWEDRCKVNFQSNLNSCYTLQRANFLLRRKKIRYNKVKNKYANKNTVFRLFEASTSSTVEVFFILISSPSTSCSPTPRTTTTSGSLTLVWRSSWRRTASTWSWRCAGHWSTWVQRWWTASTRRELQVRRCIVEILLNILLYYFMELLTTRLPRTHFPAQKLLTSNKK